MIKVLMKLFVLD